MTNIEWADKTINPIVGCSKISPGCINCYAKTAANTARLQRLERYQKVAAWNGTLVFVPEVLEQVVKRKKPTRYFVCSMSDIFHDHVKAEW